MPLARVSGRAAKPGRLTGFRKHPTIEETPMMAPKDLLLALVVILAWGVNFVVIKVGLHGMPPTLLGYGLWSRLLSRYPAAQVAQFSLLVPIVGLASSALLLDEHLTRAQLIGTALVMGGLAVNVFGGKLVRRVAAS
jgi:drug/metabolite transporter (DMT)-like permease